MVIDVVIIIGLEAFSKARPTTKEPLEKVDCLKCIHLLALTDELLVGRVCWLMQLGEDLLPMAILVGLEATSLDGLKTRLEGGKAR